MNGQWETKRDNILSQSVGCCIPLAALSFIFDRPDEGWQPSDSATMLVNPIEMMYFVAEEEKEEVSSVTSVSLRCFFRLFPILALVWTDGWIGLDQDHPMPVSDANARSWARFPSRHSNGLPSWVRPRLSSFQPLSIFLSNLARAWEELWAWEEEDIRTRSCSNAMSYLLAQFQLQPFSISHDLQKI